MGGSQVRKMLNDTPPKARKPKRQSGLNVLARLRLMVDTDKLRDLRLNDCRVLLVCVRFANYNTCECWPALKTIARLAGISDANAAHAIKRLECLNILRSVVKGGGRKRSTLRQIIVGNAVGNTVTNNSDDTRRITVARNKRNTVVLVKKHCNSENNTVGGDSRTTHTLTHKRTNQPNSMGQSGDFSSSGEGEGRVEAHQEFQTRAEVRKQATSRIEAELLAATKLARNGESDQGWFEKLVIAARDSLPTSLWVGLSLEAQAWVNASYNAICNQIAVPNPTTFSLKDTRATDDDLGRHVTFAPDTCKADVIEDLSDFGLDCAPRLVAKAGLETCRKIVRLLELEMDAKGYISGHEARKLARYFAKMVFAGKDIDFSRLDEEDAEQPKALESFFADTTREGKKREGPFTIDEHGD